MDKQMNTGERTRLLLTEMQDKGEIEVLFPGPAFDTVNRELKAAEKEGRAKGLRKAIDIARDQPLVAKVVDGHEVLYTREDIAKAIEKLLEVASE